MVDKELADAHIAHFVHVTSRKARKMQTCFREIRTGLHAIKWRPSESWPDNYLLEIARMTGGSTWPAYHWLEIAGMTGGTAGLAAGQVVARYWPAGPGTTRAGQDPSVVVGPAVPVQVGRRPYQSEGRPETSVWYQCDTRPGQCVTRWNQLDGPRSRLGCRLCGSSLDPITQDSQATRLGRPGHRQGSAAAAWLAPGEVRLSAGCGGPHLTPHIVGLKSDLRSLWAATSCGARRGLHLGPKSWSGGASPPGDGASLSEVEQVHQGWSKSTRRLSKSARRLGNSAWAGQACFII